MNARPTSPLRRNVIAMLRRANGLATDEIEGFSIRQVARAIQYCLERDEAFVGRHTGKDVRYFSSQHDADAWVEKRRLEEVAKLHGSNTAASSALPPIKATWPADAKEHYPEDKHGVPLWKLTLCPPSQLGLTRTNTYVDSH